MKFITGQLGIASAILVGCSHNDVGESSPDIIALTGAHTRVVWVQDAGKESDPLSERGELRLMGLDTDDGIGERSILPTVSNYAKPMITAAGDRVVYSDRIDRSIWVVDWDGSNLHRIADGFAVDLWRDANTGTDWVYALEHFGDEGTLPCRRLALDDPDRAEMVWDGAEITWGWFSVSGDGLRAAATCPWPDTGLLDLKSSEWHRYRKGCWPDIAPDGSHLFWALDGAHRNLHVLRESSRDDWAVDLTTIPGIEGSEVYHPRWTNHVRHLAISAPYIVGDEDIKLFKGGPEVELYLGRFDPSFVHIEAWAQITHNDRGDFWPDAWIDGGSKAHVDTSVATASASPSVREPGITSANAWPSGSKDLVFLWRDSLAPNEVTSMQSIRVCRVEPQGRARWGRDGTMNATGGFFLAPREGERIIEACRKTGAFTMELFVRPEEATVSGDATISCFDDSLGESTIRLLREEETIYVDIARATGGSAATRFPVGVAPTKAQTHLVVSIGAGTITSYVNGKRVFVANDPEIDPRSWVPRPLRFGDPSSRGSGWSGTMEGVAFYARTLENREVALNYDLYQSQLYRRSGPKSIEVRARLVHATPTPEPRTLAPYRRALGVFVYDIIGSDLDENRIQVAHWTILGGQRVTSVADRVPGAIYDLDIELFDEHLELATERILMEGVDPRLPFYYDVTNP